jgi:hypothetical protein
MNMCRLLILSLFLSLAIFGSVGAASQPPTPSRSVVTQQQQNLTKDAQNKPNDPKQETTKEVANSGNREEANKTNNDKPCPPRNYFVHSGFKLTDIALAFFTGLLTLFNYKLWRSTDRMWKATKETADAALRSATTSMATERAYIRITSCPPGIIFMEQSASYTSLFCKLGIKNYGETPAYINDIVIQAKISEVGQLLPDIPDFAGAKRYKCSKAFLVRGDSIFYQFSDETYSNKAIADIKDGK